MNALERYLACVTFKKVDRVFFHEFSIRRATLEHWYNEGLPRDVHVEDFFRFDWFWNGVSIDLGPIPPYDVIVLEETERYVKMRDAKGATVKYFKVHNTGFDTRQWLDFRVKSEEDFKELKGRFNPKTPKRYPRYWKVYAKLARFREAPYRISIPGQFWWVRDYMGLHNLLKSFYVKPNLVHEMMDFCTDFLLEALHPLLDETEVDAVTINEDMAYKTGPMIGPSFFKEFMFNNYRRLSKFLKEHGVTVVFWDTDGNPGPLLPLIVEAGINGWLPMEIAAEVDPIEVRKRFSKLVLLGGIDKRVLALGDKSDIEKEINKKVSVLLKDGGYLPTVDHAVAPETPLKNYVHYLRLLKKLGVGPKNMGE